MRKLKLLFELVFIFILPLIFMCFYLNIETVYSYDSSGNYQDSSKQITFDTIEIVNEVSNVYHGVEYVYYTEDEFNQLDQTVLSNFKFSFNNSFSSIVSFDVYFNSNNIYIDYLSNYVTFYFSGNQSRSVGITFDNYYSYVRTNSSNLVFVYKVDFWIKSVNLVEENHYKNPLYDGLVKIEDMVGINTDSVIVEFINTYNCLWLLMFAFWHLLYAFFELMVHIFDPKKYQIE